MRSIMERGMVFTSTNAPLLKAEFPNRRPFSRTSVARLRKPRFASPNPPLLTVCPTLTLPAKPGLSAFSVASTS